MACKNSSSSLCICNPSCYKRQKSQGSSCSTVSEFPISLISEILSKLPVKSVIRCECVCKSWFNLILDPHFARLYFKSSTLTAIAVPFDLLFGSDGHVMGYATLPFEFLEIEKSSVARLTPFNPEALKFPKMETLEMIESSLTIAGSCNGLICLVQSPQFVYESYFSNPRDRNPCHQEVFIINPLLGRYLMLQQVDFERDVTFGFGYSTLSERFKVFRIYRTAENSDGGCEYKVHAEIFTVGVDEKWRTLNDSSICFRVLSGGVSLNGVLYKVGDVQPSGMILGFDIEKEKGHHIQPPPCLENSLLKAYLAVWDEKLCFTDNSCESQVDIWRLDTNQGAQSWSKEIILKSWIPSELRTYSINLVTTLKNGDMLMSYNDVKDRVGSMQDEDEEDDEEENEEYMDPIDRMMLKDDERSVPHPNHLTSFNSKTKTCSTFAFWRPKRTIFSFQGYTPSFLSPAQKGCQFV